MEDVYAYLPTSLEKNKEQLEKIAELYAILALGLQHVHSVPLPKRRQSGRKCVQLGNLALEAAESHFRPTVRSIRAQVLLISYDPHSIDAAMGLKLRRRYDLGMANQVADFSGALSLISSIVSSAKKINLVSARDTILSAQPIA